MKTKLCVWISSVVGLCTHIQEEKNYFKHNFKATPIRADSCIHLSEVFVCLFVFVFFFYFILFKKKIAARSLLLIYWLYVKLEDQDI